MLKINRRSILCVFGLAVLIAAAVPDIALAAEDSAEPALYST